MAEKIDAEALQFGQMLQRYRESAKVTQQEIADATGLTKNYISSIAIKVTPLSLILYCYFILVLALQRQHNHR